MLTNNSSESTDDSFVSAEISIPGPVRFWLVLLLDIPSLICSLLLIVHILINRTQRHALYSHTILFILIFNLPTQTLDVGLYLFYLKNGFVQPAAPLLCLFWWFIDYGLYAGGILLLTWLAVERHILIFHDRWLVSQRGRVLFHYVPLMTIVSYALLFYVIVIFLLPCENIYDYSAPYCGSTPCYGSYRIVSMWEFFVHYCIPVILESIVSVGLLIRVLWQKQRLRQSTQWHKQRRMIAQLVLVSFLNIGLNLPYYIISIAIFCGLASDNVVQLQLYLYFLSYLITFFFPFASLCQFPTLRKQIKKVLCCGVERQICRTANIVPIREGHPINRTS